MKYTKSVMPNITQCEEYVIETKTIFWAKSQFTKKGLEQTVEELIKEGWSVIVIPTLYKEGDLRKASIVCSKISTELTYKVRFDEG